MSVSVWLFVCVCVSLLLSMHVIVSDRAGKLNLFGMCHLIFFLCQKRVALNIYIIGGNFANIVVTALRCSA